MTREGEPWFVAADVCRSLGLKAHKTNGGFSHHLLKCEPTSEKRYQLLPTCRNGRVRYAIVSESGLYKLIMRSDKPEAKRFQNWVTQEVLPSIRKTGSYVVSLKEND